MGQKKGLGVLGWVLIGCGGLIVLGGAVMVVGGLFVFNKAKEVAEEFEQNPELAQAKWMARLHPDIDLVSSDPEKNTVTFFNNKTEEEFVANLNDIREGKFTIKNVDGKTVFGLETNQTDGSVAVTTKEGTTVFSGDGDGDGGGTVTMSSQAGTAVYGSGKKAKLPTWLDPYPGTEPKGAYSAQTDKGDSGMFTMETGDSVDQVSEHFKKKLKDLGLNPGTNRWEVNGKLTATVTGRSADRKREVSVNVTDATGVTQITLTYSDRN